MADFDSSLEMGLEPAQDRLAFPREVHHRVARDGEADAVVRVLELKARLDAAGVSNQAAALKVPLRKNLGQKNCERSPGNRAEIPRLFLAFEDGPVPFIRLLDTVLFL